MRFFRQWLLYLGSVSVLTNSLLAFTQEVYVWQRQFSPAVYQALNSVCNETSGSAILAAEVNWEGIQPHLFRSAVNYSKLAAMGHPVGIVLRVGPYTGKFSLDDKPSTYLADLGQSLIKAARTDGLEPTELQVDFDCASSKLAGYRLWLEALRVAIAPTKLVFTALPDWLGRDEFPALATAADGYVLQVHSLEKPAGPDEVFKLCDPGRAWTWIDRADRVGVPFRVALPTYGYRLGFDAAGKFIALSAEGTRTPWPKATQVRTVRSDVNSIAILAQKLAQTKLICCTGIIWFRLPVPGDQLNWDLVTLKVVLGGNLPVSRLIAEVNWIASGLAEVKLVNRGERDESLPTRILARWSDDSLLQAADGLGGYSLASDQGHTGLATLAVAQVAIGERIAPGRSRKVAWMRFSHETILHSQIVASP